MKLKLMFDLKIIEKFYASFPKKVDNARNILGRALNLSEKILFGHLDSASSISTAKRGHPIMILIQTG